VLRDLVVELVAISRAGLLRLPGGATDAALLAPLEDRARHARTVADDLLSDFRSVSGDPRKLVQLWKL